MSLADVAAAIAALPPGRRLVALAGPPASGKSTNADRLTDAIRSRGRTVAVIPMDGFHLDNDTLAARGLRARKGAPETFDVFGLIALVRAVAEGGARDYPTFDRTADATVPAGGRIGDGDEIALFEGNYLLLDEAPWRALHPLWDATVALSVPEAELERRLMARWRRHDPANAEVRCRENDLPNARRVMTGSVPADHVLVQDAET
ncbi:MAG: phosphoribulokinase [Pseudomonadota bacterium]